MKDDMYNEDLPDEFGGDLKYLESYKKIDVDETFDGIRNDATFLIKNMCDMYLGANIITDEAYAQAIASIEIKQLSSAMIAVKSVEHALSTLMRQLDEGGYINSEIFEQINTLSKTSMELTMKSTAYIRSLPEFIKFTGEEMVSKGLSKPIEILQDGVEAKRLSANTEDIESVEVDSFNKSGPILGTRDLMLQIRDEENDLTAMINNAKNEQAKIEAENLKSDEETDF